MQVVRKNVAKTVICKREYDVFCDVTNNEAYVITSSLIDLMQILCLGPCGALPDDSTQSCLVYRPLCNPSEKTPCDVTFACSFCVVSS